MTVAPHRAAIVAVNAIGHLETPEEVAGAVVFLASRQASLVTGRVLAVDRGWTAW